MLQLIFEYRYKKENILVTLVIPGPRKPFDIHSFLCPIYKDLILLENQGVVVESLNSSIHFTATLEVVIEDIPGCADLCYHVGHMAYFGCRLCNIKATNVNFHQRYIPQDTTGLVVERPRDNFIYPEQVCTQCVVVKIMLHKILMLFYNEHVILGSWTEGYLPIYFIETVPWCLLLGTG